MSLTAVLDPAGRNLERTAFAGLGCGGLALVLAIFGVLVLIVAANAA